MRRQSFFRVLFSMLIPVVSTGMIIAATNGKIAFVSERDGNREIYTMNADGTDQVRLTNNFILDDHPTWSPDGTRIAFVSQSTPGDYAIYVMNGDGTNKILIYPLNDLFLRFNWSLSWSPDGQQITFAENDDILVVDVNSGDRENLTKSPGVLDQQPSWSPDGSRILFSRCPTPCGAARLHTIKPDGTELQALATDLLGGEYSPNWSPTGDRIAFIVNIGDGYDVIYTADANGRDRKFFDGCVYCNEFRGDPVWAPDGTKIVFRIADSSIQLYAKDVDGTGFVQLTSTGAWNFHQSWQALPTLPLAANGNIAFTSDRDGNREIYSMNPATRGHVRLTNNTIIDDHPNWSPDGKKIAFVSQDEVGAFGIYQMNADGTNRVRIIPLYNSPNSRWSMGWSPDGKQLVFQDGVAGSTDIFIVNVNNRGNRKIVTNHPASDVEPSWSPDGSRIIFSSNRINQQTTMYTVKPDGTDLRALPTDQCGWCEERAANWSPNGDAIVFQVFDWANALTKIYTARPDGSSRRLLYNGLIGNLPNPDRPDWSPDGKKVAFHVEYYDGAMWDRELCVINTDGSGLSKLTNTIGRNYNPSWQPIVSTAADAEVGEMF